MINKVLVVSSPTSDKNNTQISLVYLSTILNKLGIQFSLLDLSGTIEYFDPPQEFFSTYDSKYWLSPQIFHEASWIDDYIPSEYAEFDAVFYSALFSPDILIHERHLKNQKTNYPNSIGIIGGAAISYLNNNQLSIISKIFEYVCIGYNVEHLLTKVIENIKKQNSDLNNKIIKTNSYDRIQPNYELINIKPFVTVYSGHGCNWGKCRFCNTANLLNFQYVSRPSFEIADDFEKISQLNSQISDVMLSSDSFTKKSLIEIAFHLKQRKSKIPYNIMLRGEKWVSEELGELLHESSCTDVFIGAESLNNHILRILNKGLTKENIFDAIKNLSKYVKVIIGLILFIPGATKGQLDEQLCSIEKILPFVDAVEPEILSIVYGSEFANHPEKYGIKLWATEKNINDSWCYGLSPDIPWTFNDITDAEIWFKYYDKLKTLTENFVQPHYWDSIDYIRNRL